MQPPASPSRLGEHVRLHSRLKASRRIQSAAPMHALSSIAVCLPWSDIFAGFVSEGQLRWIENYRFRNVHSPGRPFNRPHPRGAWPCGRDHIFLFSRRTHKRDNGGLCLPRGDSPDRHGRRPDRIDRGFRGGHAVLQLFLSSSGRHIHGCRSAQLGGAFCFSGDISNLQPTLGARQAPHRKTPSTGKTKWKGFIPSAARFS